MILQPIPGTPALRMNETLIITDLHIGVEAHLGKKGFHITSRTEDMLDTILECAGTELNRLIVLGDVKDSVPGSTKQEYREIPTFFDKLSEMFDSIDLVRGNHDTAIEEFLPMSVKVRPAKGMRIGDVGFIHGHVWPSDDVMSSKVLVMGHVHPAIMFRDGVGRQYTEPCWVRGRFKPEQDRYPHIPEEFIIVPAFNRLLGGSPVNVIGEGFLGPLLTSDMPDRDNCRIHLLDGVDVGILGNLWLDGGRRMPRNLKQGQRKLG